MVRRILCVLAAFAVVAAPVAMAQEVEPNDQQAQADSIDAFVIHGSIGSDGDVDWFALQGQEGSEPTITILHDDEVDFDFEVYNNGESIGSALGVESGDSFSSEASGSVHVRVWSANGTGWYAIAINGCEAEPNNEVGLADGVDGLALVGSIGEDGDEDWFSLGGQEGTHPAFTIIHDTDVDFDFEVLSDGESAGRAVGVPSGDTVACNVPGRCTVRVWASSGSGAYAIIVDPDGEGGIPSQDSSGGGDSSGGSGSSEAEPNDTQELADSVDELTIDGAIGGADDVDWFVLGGQEGTTPTFTITHADGVDFDFEIYSDGESVGAAYGVSSGDSVDCQVPGRCHVRVWSANGTGHYSITVRP